MLNILDNIFWELSTRVQFAARIATIFAWVWINAWGSMTDGQWLIGKSKDCWKNDCDFLFPYFWFNLFVAPLSRSDRHDRIDTIGKQHLIYVSRNMIEYICINLKERKTKCHCMKMVSIRFVICCSINGIWWMKCENKQNA